MADPMRVAISGASGLIGSALRSHLEGRGHDVVAMVRRRGEVATGDVFYSDDEQVIDHEALARCDAVVHLAGEPIGARRWTDEQKREILRSRVDTTSLIAGAVADLDDGPQVHVQGSAVGYYGSRGDEVLPETASRGDGFLADVVVAWEAAAAPAEAAGARVALARTGVVIAEDGPLIDKVELPFRLGVGGVIGDGEQWVPWVSVEDEVRALAFLVENDVHGPVNLTAPEPVTNRTMTRAIGEAINRPTVLPVPVFGIRLLYGEMGVTLATSSQRCVPSVLEDAGFEWRDTDIVEPLRRALA